MPWAKIAYIILFNAVLMLLFLGLQKVLPLNNYIGEILPYNKIVYGGSANEENIDSLKSDEIDGYLLGGLSLKPQQLQTFIDKL